MITNFMKYNDSYTYSDFNVGDKVVCNGKMDSIHFNGQIGEITRKRDSYCTVKFNTRFDAHLHSGALEDDPTRSSYDINYIFLKPLDDEEYRKKKEEKRLRYISIDPYGEEEWDD